MTDHLDSSGQSADDAVRPDPVPEDNESADAAKAARAQVRREQRQLLLKSPAFVVGSLICLFWLVCAAFPQLFSGRGPDSQVRSEDDVTFALLEPGSIAWFGTDISGRDVYARVIYGARNVLITAPVAALIAVIVGTLLGLAIGYYRGWLDDVVSRFIEALLSLPVILLALMVVALFGDSRLILIATIAGLFTPVVARTVRSAVIAEVELDYVTAARLRGESGVYVMLREILPNVTGVVVVELTVRVGYAIFTVATLSFLGLSAGDASAADWGNDISNHFDLVVGNQWWPTLFPSLAIASLVVGVNLLADSLDRVLKA